MKQEIDLSELDSLLPDDISAQLPHPLVTWSEKLPFWQRDALRRIAQQGFLTEEDKTELEQALYFEHGLEEKKIMLEPLQDNHCQIKASKSEKIILCSIGSIKNINRLSENQSPLRFATNGITLIYGDNGSGKSGYCRISKAVCRARSVDPILGNVFSDAKADTPSAIIEWKKESSESKNSYQWEAEKSVPAELSTISVFDTANASIYVDGKNQLEYLPYEVDIVSQLANVCADFIKNVDGHITAAKNQNYVIPSFIDGTDVAQLIGKIRSSKIISSLPAIADIERLAKWDEKDEVELNSLRKDLENDPAQQAEIRRQCHEICKSLASKFEEVEANFTADVIEYYLDQKEKLNIAKTASELAAKADLGDMPLSDVGSDVWKALYKHARAYGEIAYPDKAFPYTDTDAVCVLCQQPLGEDARQRFIKFDEFVEGKATQEYEEQTKKYTDIIKGYSNLDIPKTEDVRQRLAMISNLDQVRKGIADEIIERCLKLHEIKDLVLSLLTSQEVVSETPQIVSVVPTLKSLMAQLEIEKSQFAQVVTDPLIKAEKLKRMNELIDRKTLSENSAQVIAVRNLTERDLKLANCRASLKTGSLSSKITQLRKEYFTDKLNEYIREEIDVLGLSYLNVSVVDNTDKGTSQFSADIGVKQKISKAKRADILSEGEQRALALACYFAEARMNEVRNGLIVDDPVSSLDQLRIRKVAERISKAAKDQHQIIVFTHNLVFFNELREAASQHNIPLISHVIHSENGEEFGVIKEDSLPLLARKVNERKAVLGEKLNAAKSVLPINRVDYEPLVKSFYSELREAWERCVEEVLLAGVVQRFQEGVKTLSLGSVVVTDEDYREIYFAMKKASEYSGHDRAISRDMALPSHDELAQDLETLNQYVKVIKKRNRDLDAERKKLQEPPKAELN